MGLIYLSPLPWNSFAQRPHKFVRWFHNRTSASVLWVDPYPTRFPGIGDFRRLVDQSTRPDLRAERPSWLTVMKPRVLPIEPLLGSAMVNKWFWRDVLMSVDGFLQNKNNYIAVGKPSVLALEILRRYPEISSLYDAMDDFPAFYRGVSRAAFSRRELQIVREVDYLWASSTELKKRWSYLRPDVRLVFNGLDMAVMPKEPLEICKRRSNEKVFGYVGTMASWFAWDWVQALARARPLDRIRLIGPVLELPPEALPSNVEILPPCDHEAALKAMLDFDVGLIPFKKNKLTNSVDPIKYYEYKALALPIISTNFGEMQCRSDVPGVFIGHSILDVASLAKRALEFDRPFQGARVFSEENDWERRFDSVGLFMD